MNRAQMVELAKELGYRQSSAITERENYLRALPYSAEEAYHRVESDRARMAELNAYDAYDKGFAQWASEGFPE